MPQIAIIAGAWVITTVIGCVVYHFKGVKTDKIEIMNVRQELKKIKKLDDANKESLF